MLHNRDEKYEGSDEPEYHFSDEESGEYADTELPKEVTSSTSEPKTEEGRARFAPSKRMIMSLVVFLALVYVVYKMVAPSSQVPTTDITTPVTAQTAPSQISKNPAMQQAPSASTMAMNNPPAALPQTGTVQGQQSGMPQQEAMQQQQVMPQQQQIMPQQQQVMPQQQQVMPQQQQMMPQQQQVMPQQQQIMPQQQQVMPQQQIMPQSSAQPPQMMPQPAAMTAAQQGAAMITGMPSVIPIQAPVQNPPYGNYNNANLTSMAPMQNPTNSDPRIATLQSDATKLMGELQSNYVQKLNDFSEQNKALQEQIQMLTTRMVTMETQMNQLVQALTHQENPGASGNEIGVPGPQSSKDQKTSYNVQAIIPGRAWLRTDNGDTLTVAEGDVIKSLGRVTKIDPYDGVVEINTGNKTLSLSYGTST